MKSFTLFLDNKGDNVQVDLRLDIDGILALKKKYNEMTVETIYSAIVEPDKLITILDKALNYPGNTNTIKAGKDLYNLLIDNDICGMEGFWEVLSGIAKESGIISGKMAERMNENANKMFDGMFANLGNENSPQE